MSVTIPKVIDPTDEQMKNDKFWFAHEHGFYNSQGDFIYPQFGVEKDGRLIDRYSLVVGEYSQGTYKPQYIKIRDFTLSVASQYAKLNGGEVVITSICTIFSRGDKNGELLNHSK